ncbi:MAG: GIY-YIG nuclease family protein [Gemmataceae bacterium]|nr:GIY-YIG nuclease family protein [Gemmata sp.]MDW8199141.1 GIY-YIG nuclease family protein [Gemmataceae bacterium]
MKRASTDGHSPHAPLFPSRFDGFGPSRFRPAEEVPIVDEIRGRHPGTLHREVKRHAPVAPGVYGMLDRHHRLIYVGKAKNLRCRLLSYFRENSRNPKAGKIIEPTRRLVWEQTGDEFAALLRELELIQRIRPKFNVRGIPGLQRYHYICLGRPPAPYVYVTSRPTGNESAIYGPLVRWYRSETAARRLNDWFRLRDCPQSVALHFADQGELFDPERAPQCLRYELGTCLGPCAGTCTRREYAERVRAVKAFLDGRNRSILRQLHQQMLAAAAALEFEKALSLREKLTAVQWLDERLRWLRRARNQGTFVYPLRGVDDRHRWYVLDRGQVRAVVYAPTAANRAAVAATLTAIATDAPRPAILSETAVDSVLLVLGWFQKYRDERAQLFTLAQAQQLLQET